MLRTMLLTTAAMVAFAANSLLARQALGAALVDAGYYTAIRIVSGAALLAILLRAGGGGETKRTVSGSWTAAAALFVYAICFSLAYLQISAATGALILFASVQATMITVAVWRGDRPDRVELSGLVIAFGAFIYLLSPGLGRPAPLGSALMILSGIAWGIYTLRGRGSKTPLADTAGNFLRASAFCVPVIIYALAREHLNGQGVLLALASGALASGLGYSIWYRALPGLSTIQAALVQLSVPVIAAAGAVLFLTENLTTRLVVASILILGGITLAIFAKRKRQA